MVTMLTIFLMAMVCQDKCWNSFYLKYWQSKPISHYFLFHRYASLWLESSFIWTRGKLGRMDTTTSPAAGEENNNNYKQLTRIVEGNKDLFIILYQRWWPETVSQINTALCFTYSCIHGNEGRKIKRIDKSNQNKNVHQIWTTYKNRS